jgi:L-amino acid N-acyltransferase YncA
VNVRRATADDSQSIVRIYNEGIADRIATFETNPYTEAQVRAWFERPHPIVVVERDGAIIAFAAAQPSSLRACYARNAEFSVYVQRDVRGQGAGRVAMRALAAILREMRFNKLVSHVFVDNEASLRMLRGVGFRDVGTLARHGDLEGRWCDVVVMEMLL